MLAAETGKAPLKTLRPYFQQFVDQVSSDTQFGSGLHHGSNEAAHTYVKAAVEYARRSKKSVAVLFFA